MRVLIISENRCRDNLVPYPLGPAYVAGAARAAGHEVAGLDLMLSSDPAADVERAVRDFDPQVVGLSIRNIDNQDMLVPVFFVEDCVPVVEAVKGATDAPIVAGGSGFSMFPLQCLNYLGLEIGVVGEGEAAFVELLDVLEKGEEVEGLAGLALNRNGVREVNPPVHAFDLDELAPDRDAFDVTPYRGPGPVGPPMTANLQTRRGCHMRCTYCSTPMIEGRVVRCRSVLSAADELESMDSEFGVRFCYFADSLFNYPGDYAVALLKELASRELKIKWCSTFAPFEVDERLFPLLNPAGCSLLSLGNESGSDPVLSSLKKGFDRDAVVRAAKCFKAEGVHFSCFLMLGGPGETRETVEESVELMDELEPDAVLVTPGIRIYPGCEIETTAVERGTIKPGQDLLRPVFYIEPGLEDWLYGFAKQACAERPGWSF